MIRHSYAEAFLRIIFNRMCLSAVSLILLTGCGYRFGGGGNEPAFKTISIPFVEGDTNGNLTSSIIQELSESGGYTYSRQGGDFELCIKLIDFSDENIGFRYDRKKNGRLRKSIIPVETRLTVIAEVMLINCITRQALIGPVKISACVDFDHDYCAGRKGVNAFSLGQLEDYDAAYEAVIFPLNTILAKKIVALIHDNW